jgi:hypothetical protein
VEGVFIAILMLVHIPPNNFLKLMLLHYTVLHKLPQSS